MSNARASDHYLAAFRDFLDAKDWPYVALGPGRAETFAAAGLGSFDLLIHSGGDANLLAVVQGHGFPDVGPAAPKRRAGGRAWDNSLLRADIDGLSRWQGVWGPEVRAAVVFAYRLHGRPERSPFADVHLYGRRAYAFVAVWLDDYLAHAKLRSVRWRALTLPADTFASLARDVVEFL